MKILLITPVLLIIFLILYFEHMPHLDMATKNIENIFFTIAYTFSVIILIVYLAYRMDSEDVHVVPHKIKALILKFGNQSMLVYIAHPYTNNVAYLLSNYFLGVGYWYVMFVLTAAMLMALIQIKLKYSDSPFFKYL